MPAPGKVRWAQLRVGVMATVAMIIAAALIFLLTNQKPIWESYSTLYTYMEDSSALARGSPLRLNGILIGSVERVELSGSKDPKRTVRVVMKARRENLKDIPVDSTAGISSENVLGSKFINITKGRSTVSLQPNGEVKSEESAEIQDLMRKGFGLFDSAQAILMRIDRIVGLVESGKGSIGKFLVDEEFYNRLVKTIAEMQQVTEAVNSGKGTVGNLLYDESLYNEARSSIARLDQVIAGLQARPGHRRQAAQGPGAVRRSP